MKIIGEIALSKVQCSDSDDYISITIADSDARVTFAEVKLDLVSFARMMTGSASVNCDIEVRGLENVGKVKEQKQVSFELPKGSPFANNKPAAIAILDEIDDGWTYSPYLGSQNSFYLEGDKRYFRTWASRWVDKNEAE